jgi:predicted phosphoribosyltransferase
VDAGRQLGARLKQEELENACIVSLPRGGVPLAVEIAKITKLPWDFLPVKKIVTPAKPEFAIGAIAEGTLPVWNTEATGYMIQSENDLQQLAKSAFEKIQQQMKKWRLLMPALNVMNKTVILVDDGLATGLTMKAAIAALKRSHVEKIIVAVPVAPESAVREFQKLVSKLIILKSPTCFRSVGDWYDDFSEVSDKTVENLLKTTQNKMRNEAHLEDESQSVTSKNTSA